MKRLTRRQQIGVPKRATREMPVIDQNELAVAPPKEVASAAIGIDHPAIERDEVGQTVPISQKLRSRLFVVRQHRGIADTLGCPNGFLLATTDPCRIGLMQSRDPFPGQKDDEGPGWNMQACLLRKNVTANLVDQAFLRPSVLEVVFDEGIDRAVGRVMQLCDVRNALLAFMSGI